MITIDNAGFVKWANKNETNWILNQTTGISPLCNVFVTVFFSVIRHAYWSLNVLNPSMHRTIATFLKWEIAIKAMLQSANVWVSAGEMT